MKEEEETDQTKSPEKIGGGGWVGSRPISMHCVLGHVIEAKLHKIHGTAFLECRTKCILPKITFATPPAYLSSPPPPVFSSLPSICLQGEETCCHECRLWTTSQSLAIELHTAAKQISANSHSGISHGCVRSSKHAGDPIQSLLTANSPLLLFFPHLKHDKMQDYAKPPKGELRATLDIYRRV